MKISHSASRWRRGRTTFTRFERKYDKAFEKVALFGTNLIDRIHKRVQVFLQPCNMNPIEDVELGALAEFGGL